MLLITKTAKNIFLRLFFFSLQKQASTRSPLITGDIHCDFHFKGKILLSQISQKDY